MLAIPVRTVGEALVRAVLTVASPQTSAAGRMAVASQLSPAAIDACEALTISSDSAALR